MNVIIIKVNFEKRTLQKERVVLTAGDYNSTKLVFQFDKDYEEKKVFELAKPGTSEAIFVKEIVDNEIVLVGYDAEGNEASLFSEIGKYPFEISLYGENSKLTSLSSTLTVKEGKVEVDNKVVECYIPIFDDLMNTATTLINNLEATEEILQKAEESRATNENERQEAEEERVKNEEERAEAEEGRNSAETERVEAEKARIQNEETRQSNEEDRITNETARGDAEKARSEAEEERNENETTRKQNEEDRAKAETSRVKAEETRETSEKARVETEKNRVTAETKRAEDEESRADAEEARNEAETKRVNAETARDEAETTRNEAETTRNNNETEREEAEKVRNENESTRNANEIIRQEKFRMIDNTLKSITVEGSNIHVSDSADWFAKVGVCGKSEQETREGYNKANYNTSTTNTNFDIGDIKVGVDYTLAFEVSGSITTNIRYKALKENIKSALTVTDNKYILNFQSAHDDILMLNTYSSTEGFRVTEIMLLEGTYTADTLPAFEEYGKKPSLEFESPVKSVGDNINLFNWETILLNKTINNQGVVSNSNYNFVSDYIAIEPNTQYRVNEAITCVYEFDENFNIIREIRNSQTAAAFRTSANAKYLRVRNYYSTGDLTELAKTAKLEKGSKSTLWSPYGKGSVEVEVCNKNLFNKDNANIVNGYFTNKLFSSQSTSIRTLYIKCNSNTSYTVSKVLSSRFAVGTSEVIPAQGVTITNFIQNNGATELSITSGNNDNYLYVFYYHADNDTLTEQEILDSIQIEVGTEATVCEPHQSQTYPLHLNKELNGDETIRDRPIKIDGKWFYEFKWAKRIFNGTESWALSGNTNDSRLVVIIGTGGKSIDHKGLSNYFTRNSEPTIGTFDFYNNNQNLRFCLDRTIYTSIDDFKAKLVELYNAGAPLYVVYRLIEPVYEEITDETLKSQLDAIEKAYTYQTVTNILSDAHLEVTYKKDLQTQLNEIQALVLESGV